jgi:hypothetical protein
MPSVKATQVVLEGIFVHCTLGGIFEDLRSYPLPSAIAKCEVPQSFIARWEQIHSMRVERQLLRDNHPTRNPTGITNFGRKGDISRAKNAHTLTMSGPLPGHPPRLMQTPLTNRPSPSSKQLPLLRIRCTLRPLLPLCLPLPRLLRPLQPRKIKRLTPPIFPPNPTTCTPPIPL